MNSSESIVCFTNQINTLNEARQTIDSKGHTCRASSDLIQLYVSDDDVRWIDRYTQATSYHLRTAHVMEISVSLPGIEKNVNCN